MSTEPIRYYPDTKGTGHTVHAVKQEYEGGDYVTYTDYAALRAKLEETEAERGALKAQLEHSINGWNECAEALNASSLDLARVTAQRDRLLGAVDGLQETHDRFLSDLVGEAFKVAAEVRGEISVGK